MIKKTATIAKFFFRSFVHVVVPLKRWTDKVRIDRIQDNSSYLKTNFKCNMMPSQSLKCAALGADDLMRISSSEHNRNFVQNFCNSLTRILQSEQIQRIWLAVCKEHNIAFILEYYAKNNAKKAVKISFDKNCNFSGKDSNLKEGIQAMQAIIEYAKTIKDIPEQKLELSDSELKNYALDLLNDVFQGHWNNYNYR